jgi:voltage-gated potassium channel
MAFDKHDSFLFRIGFGGVDPAESAKAKRWGKRLEWPMLFLALWILVDWYMRSQGLGTERSHLFTDWLIWLGFVVELAIMLLVVRDRKRFLRQNWMSLVIILGGLPAIWGAHSFYAGAIRILRLLVVVGILFKVSRDLRSILARHHLGTTLSICLVFLIISGLVISTLDPAFDTPWDGIWWAWVTITTVGYGDIVPATNEGRLFGAILILVGISMFSLLTASFSVFFIEKDETEIALKEKQNLERIHHLENHLERIEEKLERAISMLESAHPGASTKASDNSNGRE